MLDLLLPAIAVLGVAAIALAGRRAIDTEDDRADLVAMIEAPAVWTPAIADESIAR